jgi:metal-responsive CopG/Arc/MetJ family transcriptional regulator
VRVKTSVTLPDDLLGRIDREEPNRSAFFEKAARKYLHDVDKARRERGDAAILEKSADRLNKEAADVLEYQALPE